MGILAECWQTPHTHPPRSHLCPSGMRIPSPGRLMKHGKGTYHPLHPRDKQGRGRDGLRDDSSPGARPPKGKTLESNQSRDRTCVAGANRRLAAPLGEVHFHSVSKAQSAGTSTATGLFVFAKRENSVPTLYARNQELELEP